jgi:hypothetical protein
MPLVQVLSSQWTVFKTFTMLRKIFDFWLSKRLKPCTSYTTGNTVYLRLENCGQTKFEVLSLSRNGLRVIFIIFLHLVLGAETLIRVKITKFSFTFTSRFLSKPGGLYYKHVTFANDASSGVNKWCDNLERHFWRC